MAVLAEDLISVPSTYKATTSEERTREKGGQNTWPECGDLGFSLSVAITIKKKRQANKEATRLTFSLHAHELCVPA